MAQLGKLDEGGDTAGIGYFNLIADGDRPALLSVGQGKRPSFCFQHIVAPPGGRIDPQIDLLQQSSFLVGQGMTTTPSPSSKEHLSNEMVKFFAV